MPRLRNYFPRGMSLRLTAKGQAYARLAQSDQLARQQITTVADDLAYQNEASIGDSGDNASYVPPVLTPDMEHRPLYPHVFNPKAHDAIRIPATWEEGRYTVQVGPRLLSPADLPPPGGEVVTLERDREYGPGRFDRYPGPRFIGLPSVGFRSEEGTLPETSLYNATWQRYVQTVNQSEQQWTQAANPYIPTGGNYTPTFMNGNDFTNWSMQFQTQTSAATMAVNYFSGTDWGYNTPMTDEQKAQYAVAEAERIAARTLAKATAETLLKRHLDDAQRETWERERRIVVWSQKGNCYEIREGRSRNITLLVDGKPSKRYCIHPNDYEMPDQDVVLVQKMLLECDEDRFLKIAICSRIERLAHPSGLVDARGAWLAA